MITLLYVILWIWQLPQNLIGFLFSVQAKTRHIGPAGFKFIMIRKPYPFPFCCLGEFLYVKNTEMCRFVYGRGILSRIFGPFYIPVVTIPTVLTILLGSEFWFFRLWTTRWSMKLGERR